MKSFFTHFAELLSVIGLAAFGGLTRTIYGKARGDAYSWKIAVPEIIIAIFSGLLIHWLTLELGMSENMRSVAIALAGYSARSVVAICNSIFVTFVKRHVEIEQK